MSWEVVHIGDNCEVLSAKRIFAKDYVDSGIPFYRSKEIIYKAFNQFEGDEVFIKEERFNEIKNKFGAPKKGDVLISSVGNRSGISYWVKDEYDFYFKDGNLIWFRNFNDVMSSKYLVYFLNSKLGQAKINNMFIGAAQKALTIEGVKRIKLSLPPSETQKQIADILSAYDDLIENNLKRIKLLEQAAQNIYKEWFVNMRFPSHENTTINSETGLPEGWEEKGICEFNSFKQYKSKIQPFEGEKEYLATANVNGIAIEERGDSFTYENKPSRAQIHPPLNSIWFARMSETDKVLFITEKTNNDFMISSGFAGFKAEKKELLPFLFCLINNSKFSKLKDANATGSTQVSINNKSLNSIKFIEPTYEMIEKFGALNYDSLELIQHLFKANEKLKSARDILLPRLMNQTIEV